ncbi:MAG TPA: nucleotidyltransferase family protein [Pseudonocardiaceae bacterium]
MALADMPAEWQLLVLVSVADEADDRFRQATTLTRERRLDTDRLVGMAARHGLAPRLGYFLQQSDRFGILPVNSKRHLREALERNRDRTRRHVREALRITDDLRRAGLTVAVTKGVAAQATLYDQTGTRSFNDIDLMVLPDERGPVADVLAALGYQEGRAYQHRTGRLVDIPREETLAYQLYPDHLPHLTRLTGDEGLPYFVADVAFSLTWYTSGWQVPMAAALARCPDVVVNDGKLPVLDPVFDFLFLCLHLFREGWLAATIASKDVRLAQFADVLRHWQRFVRDRAAELADAVDRFNLHAPIGWITAHTDRIFGSAITSALGLAEYATDDWLGSACVRQGEYLSWPGTMSERLAQQGSPTLTAHPRPDRVAVLVPPGRSSVRE